jgi:hypothetical protein
MASVLAKVVSLRFGPMKIWPLDVTLISFGVRDVALGGLCAFATAAAAIKFFIRSTGDVEVL